ncbi:MAG: PH domain-containing protein, partial [Actinomycetota bacterium]|nr:PH domain-containing protein [Actinomycetota bacterium]
SGLLVRRTVFVPSSRLQSLALTASPWQRQRRLATLELQIPRSPGVWSGPRLIDLDVDSGRRLLTRLAAEQW